MRRKYVPHLTGVARRLRRDQTPAEAVLWRHLRAKRRAGFRFRRQQPVGPYVVDFLCSRAALVVEADGETHLGKEESDAARQSYLERQGLMVLRFWNSEVYDNPEGVVQRLLEVCESRCGSRAESGAERERRVAVTPHPSPPPQGGRESGHELAAEEGA